MGNSTVKLQSVVDLIKTMGTLSVGQAAGGFSVLTWLAIFNDVLNDMVSQKFNWKWNRIKIPPFLTISYQTDYILTCQMLQIGWLESATWTDINSTSMPKQRLGIEAVRDLRPTTWTASPPRRVCWMQNDTLEPGAWPGAGVTYLNPLGVTSTPTNPPTLIYDLSRNILFLTTYGTTAVARRLNAVGHAFMMKSRPLGDYSQGAIWGGFTLDSPLPADAVIQGIYPVLVASGTHQGVFQYLMYGAGLGFGFAGPSGPAVPFLQPFNVNFGYGGTNQSFASTEFHGASIGTSLSALIGQTILMALYASTFQDGLTDQFDATAVGYAIYYTSATAQIDPQMAPPFAVPAGQGVMWALPTTVEVNPDYQPGIWGSTGSPATFTPNLGPDAGANAAPCTTVLDGSVVWTVADPKGQGFRIHPMPPVAGVVYQVDIVAQANPAPFLNLTQTLAPIPDDYANSFRSGAYCYCHKYATDPVLKRDFLSLRNVWLADLMSAVKQGDREVDSAGFIPSRSALAQEFCNDIGPANPFGTGWPGGNS